MFQLSTADEHEVRSEGGTRQLFALDGFVFHDALDGEGRMHHFVLEPGVGQEEPAAYETDAATMYELMARYLAGLYEMDAYDLETSPAHDSLLDLLEIAAARARAGEGDFTLADLDEEFASEKDEEDELGEDNEDNEGDEDDEDDEDDDERGWEDEKD